MKMLLWQYFEYGIIDLVLVVEASAHAHLELLNVEPPAQGSLRYLLQYH